MMKKSRPIILIVLICSIASCNYDPSGQNNFDHSVVIPAREHSVLAVLWQQHASEKRALQLQAYNLARYQLDKRIGVTDAPKKLAIITDIDETILDNSLFNGRLISADQNYSSRQWKNWTDLAQADTIPGALDFFMYATSLGVEVFYVTNRKIEEQTATLKNLNKYGFPFANISHLYMRGDTLKIPGDKSNNKEARRRAIMANYEILLLLGDNLDDFTEVFYDQSTKSRNARTDSLRMKFGSSFIVLPNVMYGTWETEGIYEGKFDLSDYQKFLVRLDKTQAY